MQWPRWSVLLMLGAAGLATPAAAARESSNDAKPPVPQDAAPAQGSGSGPPAAIPPAGDLGSMGLEITDFRQNEPGDGDPVSLGTKAYVSYDRDNLYVMFVCQDDPALVRAHVTPRERITDDDRVTLYLDTFDDNQRAYVFEVNPLGIQRDGRLTEGQDDDYVFDLLWYSEGHLTPFGYAVRMRIPFASLRFPNQPVQTWGIGLGRYIERKNEKSYWPYITDRIEGFVNQLGSLQGVANVSRGRTVNLVPYTVVAEDRFLDDQLDEAAFLNTREGRLGLDAKIVLRDAYAVDLAVRPDFSQVEPDDPQVTVNQRFEKKVDEKRPFFLENAGFFETPIELFFSRRIADPSGGARVTAKQGPWALGALFMDDQEPGNVPFDDPFHDQRAFNGVVRAQREFHNQSTVGMFVSDRELAGSFNRVYAADTRLKFGKNWVATGQYVQADTREIDEPSVGGNGGYFKLRRAGRFFDWSAKYTQLSPAFNAELGFIKRTAYRELSNDWQYTFRPKKSVVNAWGPTLSGSLNWAWEGRLQDAEVQFSNKVELPADTKFEGVWTETYELYKGLEFRLWNLTAIAESEWIPWLGFAVQYDRGTDVNHDPAKKVSPFRGDAQQVEASVTVRPTSRLEVKQSFTHSWLRAVQSSTLSDVNYQRVFTNWITKTKLKFQLNRELSVRAIANYEALIPNKTLSKEDESREFVPDFLITYLVNPWTALYAGYTERYENVLLQSGEIVAEPRSTRGIDLPSTAVDRQYFVKLSYLVRF